MKTVLFVAYGGGHVGMVIPVMRELQQDPGVRTVALALSTAAPVFKREGLDYLGYKDFLLDSDTAALTHGQRIAASMHAHDSGIDEAESIAYFGLSYADLIERHGEAEAARLFEEKGRHAFLQLGVLRRVFDKVRPDLLITTTSPRSEAAACLVAAERGVPSIAMEDLFGMMHFCPIRADLITVISEPVIDEMIAFHPHLKRSQFVVTGNPSFDRAVEHAGEVDLAWRKQQFPTLDHRRPALLWIDMPGFFDVANKRLIPRDDAEVRRTLDLLAEAAERNGANLLVRPHPSQGRTLFAEWLKSAPPHVALAADLPLYPLLRSIDAAATISSTAGLEALLMQRRLLQLRFHDVNTGMPMAEWGIAWRAGDPAALPGVLHSVLHDEARWQMMKQKISLMFPPEKAAPKVAALARKLIAKAA